MNKLIPFLKFSSSLKKQPYSSGASVIMDENSTPLGFVFGRNSFISLCTIIDNEFEEKVKDPKKAYNNPAGRLIDLIESRLPVNPGFTKKLKISISEAKQTGWIPLEELNRFLHV